MKSDKTPHQRIADQVNAAVGSEMTAGDVEAIARERALSGFASEQVKDRAAYWLAQKLLEDEA